MATIKFKRGSGVPTGLTAYEAAWDTSLGRFFIHNGSTATWIGARIDDATSLGGAGACAYFVPTQLAVKTYVDNQVAGGAVTSINGATGAVTLGAGAGLSVSTSTSSRGITFTNIGVLAIQAGAGLSSSGQTGNVTLTNTGVLTFNGSIGAVQGVSSISGTSNQITASGSTGAVTLSLPSTVITPGSLTVTGDLTVNGTTTTVNSTTVTVQDPIIAIGGYTGNAAAGLTGDLKDRGVIFQWNTGVAGATGFFGHDQSAQRFTYIPSGLAVTNEIVSGTIGAANFSGVFAPAGILTLQGTSGANANIILSGNTSNASTTIDYTANEHLFKNASTGLGRIALQGDSLDPSLKGVITIGSSLTAARTYTMPNLTGQVVVAATSPVQNRILLGDVSGSAPYWADPSTGITANNSNNILLTSDNTDPVCFVTFVANGTNGMQSLRYNTGFTYNAVTNYLEVNIDGGGY